MDFFRFGLFLNSSATNIVLVTLPSTAVETAIAQCTSRCAVVRRHRLNTSIVLAAVHCLSSLFWAVSVVEPSLSHLLSPPVSVPNKQHHFCGRRAIRSSTLLSLVGNWGHLTWVRHSSHKTSATHSYQCVQYLRVLKHWYGCQSLGFLTCPQMLLQAIAHRGAV